MLNLQKRIIICGHYGSGKTNFTLNLATFLAGRQEPVTIVDFDIVNPYFRAGDFQSADPLIKTVATRFGGTTLDVPGLTPHMHAALNANGTVLLDVGGDDVGATALGGFSAEIQERPYQMLYVINQRRERIANPADAAALMREIETTSRLRCTHLVNNTHLCGLTDADVILDSLEYAQAVSALTGLPLLCTTAPALIAPALAGKADNLFPVQRLVKTPF